MSDKAFKTTAVSNEHQHPKESVQIKVRGRECCSSHEDVAVVITLSLV